MEQLSFDLNDFDSKEKDINSLANAREAFACCHRYRQCSDAGTCIVPDDPDAINCVYRLNLANGKVFEGKNANDFDLEVYTHIKNTYLSLDSATKEEMNCLILYYGKYRSSVLWYNSSALQRLKELGFCDFSIPKKMILNLYQLTFLKQFVDKDTMNLLDEQERKRLNKNNVRAKKGSYVNWLLNNPISELDNLISTFAFVSFPQNISRYIFELLHDYLSDMSIYQTYKPKIISRLPRMQEKDFVKPKDK